MLTTTACILLKDAYVWYNEKHTQRQSPEVILPWCFAGTMKLQSASAGLSYHVIYFGTKSGQMCFKLTIWRSEYTRCGLSFFKERTSRCFVSSAVLSSPAAINLTFSGCVVWPLASGFWCTDDKSRCKEQDPDIWRAHLWPFNHREGRYISDYSHTHNYSDLTFSLSHFLTDTHTHA